MRTDIAGLEMAGKSLKSVNVYTYSDNYSVSVYQCFRWLPLCAKFSHTNCVD